MMPHAFASFVKNLLIQKNESTTSIRKLEEKIP